MRTIEHRGIVEDIQGHNMKVRIVQASACSDCHSSNVCLSADKEEKIIDIKTESGNYVSGQAVMVIGRSSNGLKAVFLAYVLPLVLLVSVMAISLYILFPDDEGISALMAIGSTVLYYLLLIPFRKTLHQHLTFTVRPLSEKLSDSFNDTNCNIT